MESRKLLDLIIQPNKGSRQKKNSVENLVGPPLPPLERDTFSGPQNSFQLNPQWIVLLNLRFRLSI